MDEKAGPCQNLKRSLCMWLSCHNNSAGTWVERQGDAGSGGASPAASYPAPQRLAPVGRLPSPSPFQTEKFFVFSGLMIFASSHNFGSTKLKDI